MMRLKDKSVIVSGLETPMLFAWGCVYAVYRLHDNGRNCVVTSGNDSKHMDGSLHYQDRALDFRIWGWTREQAEDAADDIQTVLGPDFDVVLESTHLHVELDPK